MLFSRLKVFTGQSLGNLKHAAYLCDRRHASNFLLDIYVCFMIRSDSVLAEYKLFN